jgi:hypothetical protein
MGAGYSKRTLVEKLGIKPGHRVCFVNAPAGYKTLLGPLPEAVVEVAKGEGDLDLLQFFAMSHAEIIAEVVSLSRLIKSNGALWISWPKRASGIATDLDENVIRDIGLAGGLVDVKVIAVDQDWSGLKFVYRLKDRK